MRFLLDSNVLYWMFAERSALTPRVLHLLEDDQHELLAARTSIWELSAKVSAGRLSMPGGTVQSLLDQIALASVTVIGLDDRYILRAETLPYHHSDPFDRLLVAIALENDLTILSSDSKLPLYAAQVIWT